jgi:hypothetical protein
MGVLGDEEAQIILSAITSEIPDALPALEKLKKEQVKVLAEHGEVGNGRSRVDNINSTQGGTSETYTLSRLKREG